jgi:hypothetical protein
MLKEKKSSSILFGQQFDVQRLENIFLEKREKNL